MEYCEGMSHLILVGDLSYHIKKKKKSGDHFSEEEILNWFI